MDEELERVLDAIGDAVPEERREAFRRFAALYHPAIPKRFRAFLQGDSLKSFLLARWAFLQPPIEGWCRLSVETPTGGVEPWRLNTSVIQARLVDRPFIVDSMREILVRRKLSVHLTIHPILCIERDEAGEIRSVGSGREEGTREACVYMHVDRVEGRAELEEIERKLREVLLMVCTAVDDYPVIRSSVANLAEHLVEHPELYPEINSANEQKREFFNWLLDGNFTFLACRRLTRQGESFVPEPGKVWGLYRRDRTPEGFLAELERELADEFRSIMVSSHTLAVIRTGLRSPVHRSEEMDYIAVRRRSPDKGIDHVVEILGLFTTSALLEKPQRIPLIRTKIARVVADLGFIENSHSYKTVISISYSLPKEFLFNSTIEDLREEVETLMEAEDSEQIVVSLRPKRERERLIATIVMRERHYDAELRDRLLDALNRKFRPSLLRDYHTTGEGAMSRLHVYLFDPTLPDDEREIWQFEEYLEEMIRPWDTRLSNALEAMHPGLHGRELALRYSRIFPEAYENTYDPDSALYDIGHLVEIARSGGPRIGVFRYLAAHVGPRPEALTAPVASAGQPPALAGPAADAEVTEARLYSRHKVPLSEIMPILTNAGLTVVDERATEVMLPDGQGAFIHAFRVRDRTGQPIPRESTEKLSKLLVMILTGRCQSDELNGLVLFAGLDWRGAELLVTYRNLMMQVSRAYSMQAANRALLDHPEAARALFSAFECRFDPSLEDEARQELWTTRTEEFFKVLERVTGIIADRFLRNLYRAIEATLRTNFFIENRADDSIAIKLSSAALPNVPDPKPAYEIYVHGPGVEGVHLRGGKIARGGIRWSDRPDDFRIEVLGLMKAQMIKNSVIVPVGSKGGFVLTRSVTGRDERQQEMVKQYKVFIRGLLDLTDNIVKGQAVHPPGVVCRGEYDPYLVVAADKGTAQMSDTANELSKQYGFWLGDAFASGGSAGYSHKDIGITARGGWVCVERHFREMGIDLGKQEFTVVGIGDMSGDVFGNGLLRSRKAKLLAAFDHRHIFIDPDPDPQTSFDERQRLYDLPRSSWMDYDRSKLSRGGGIYDRGSKRIALSAEARSLLGIEEWFVNGNELIRAILRANCDLLWNGGIGTYVKSARESHLDAGDKTNDEVRVNAAELRAKVVGEGGNLGVTQLGRIEFARKGGRINLDAIDNSGGVDCSDHEVNLKILFQLLMEKGLIPGEEERNRILFEARDQVADQVLHANYLQSALLSMDEIRSREDIEPFITLIGYVESKGYVARDKEYIPSDEELRSRPLHGQGLPRPTLAVLTGWAKNDLYAQLVESPLPDRVYYNKYIISYLPPVIWERFGEVCLEHRLRREIIATHLANRILNQAGIAFVVRMQQDSGEEVPEIVRAYTLVNDLLDGDRFRREVHALDGKVPARMQYTALLELENTIASICRRVLRSRLHREISGDMVNRYASEVGEFRMKLRDHVSSEIRTELQTQESSYVETGFPKELAQEIAAMRYLKPVLAVIRIREATGASLEQVAGLWYRLGDLLYIHFLTRQIERLELKDEWERELQRTYSRDLAQYQHELTSFVLNSRQDGEAPEQTLDRFLKERKKSYARLKIGVTRLKATGASGLVPVSVLKANYEEMLES